MPGHRLATGRLSGFNRLLIAVSYKWYATAIVVILMVLDVKQTHYSLILLLVVYNCAYSFIVLKRLFNLRRKILMLGVDLVLCSCLLFISGSWASLYFQYGLSFLILSALFLAYRGAVLSIALYGIFYYIGLYLNGLSLDKIIAKGYLEPFITDYVIFAAVGLTSAFISKVLSNLDLRAHDSEDCVPEEKPTIESLPTPLPFTPQQAQVACLMANGLNNYQIASELGISANTVKYHIKNIYRILAVNNRFEAIQRLLGDKELSPTSTSKDKTAD